MLLSIVQIVGPPPGYENVPPGFEPIVTPPPITPEPSVNESSASDIDSDNAFTQPKRKGGRPKKKTHDGRKGAGRPSKSRASSVSSTCSNECLL